MTQDSPATSAINSAPLAEAVELLLHAAFSKRQPGGASTQFLFGAPGTPSGLMRLGAEVYFSQVGLLRVALQVRSIGPSYLRSLTVSSVQSRLMDFLKENFHLLSSAVWGRDFEGPYAPRVMPVSQERPGGRTGQVGVVQRPTVPDTFPAGDSGGHGGLCLRRVLCGAG